MHWMPTQIQILMKCLEITETVGSLVEDFKKNGAKISSGLYKDQMVEMNLHRSVVEGNGFDLLAMGRGEGPGCYCAANNLFKKYIDMLQTSYDYVVMDNEAGMEHLSRKTTHDVDYLLIISDPSRRGILSAARIRDLTSELAIKARRIFLIFNRVNDGLDERLKNFVIKADLEILGVINTDDALTDLELDGKDIFDLDPESSSILQTRNILQKLNV